MPLPKAPFPGMVVRFGFLWPHEAAQAAAGGPKDRPCVIVLARKRLADGRWLVRVAPITHTRPASGRGVELPAKVKRHLGLDEDASWIILDTFNQFVWPGVDLRPIGWERPGVWTYGTLPVEVFQGVLDVLVAVAVERRATLIQRD